MNCLSIVTILCTAYYTVTPKIIAKNTTIARFRRVIVSTIINDSNAFCVIDKKFSPGENFKFNHLFVRFSIMCFPSFI